MIQFTLAELNDVDTIKIESNKKLKYCTVNSKVWLAITTNIVTIESLMNGDWHTVAQYEAI